jgi:hypothetical protein
MFVEIKNSLDVFKLMIKNHCHITVMIPTVTVMTAMTAIMTVSQLLEFIRKLKIGEHCHDSEMTAIFDFRFCNKFRHLSHCHHCHAPL